MLDGLLERSKAKGLAVFRGSINPQEHQVVDWDEDSGDLWAFLDVAGQVGARMLYGHAWRFDENDLEGALEALEPGEDDPLELRDLRQRLDAYRTYLGHISSLHVLFLLDGVFHAWSRYAPWHVEFVDLRDAQDEEPLPEEDGEEERYEQLQERRKQLFADAATALANDPKFPDCPNETARLLLLRRLKPGLGDELSSPSALQEIVREAAAIYALDVRPRQRAAPRERALELKRQGFTVSQIAAKLSLKATEIEKLIAE
jgi:hypothetical protein